MIDWDRTDDRGRQVQSGVYFCRLETNGMVLIRKLVIVR
jgi:hypothetical protein